MVNKIEEMYLHVEKGLILAAIIGLVGSTVNLSISIGVMTEKVSALHEDVTEMANAIEVLQYPVLEERVKNLNDRVTKLEK